MARFRTFQHILLAVAGALPLLTAHFWYKISLIAYNEIGLVRALALLGALGAVLVAVAMLVSVSVWPWMRAERIQGVRWIRTAFFAGVLVNLCSVGLSVYHSAPSLAPMPARLAAGVAFLTLLTAFLRYRDDDQIFVARFLCRFGLCLLLVPALASPWILQGALSHAGRFKDAISPPVEPALRPDRPARILLVTFDALAAGRTSLHDSTLSTTPTLRQLSQEGAWYANCRSSSDGTIVSLGTVLTGLSPRTIQPRLDNKMGYIPFNAVSGVSGFLKQAGYRSLYATMYVHPSAFGVFDEFERGAYNSRRFFTSDFLSRDYIPLREALGFAWRSLQREQATKNLGEFHQHPLPAVGKTFDQARQLLQEAASPAFMWVHIGAPHLPYARTGAQPRMVTVEEAEQANASADPAKALEIRGVYDDYVRYVDGELGRFIDGLKQDGLWDDALVIVTSDHGESHRPGRIGHGGGVLFKEQAHVPLVIRSPRNRPTGRFDEVVGHVDLVPTILSAVYREPPAGLPGRSLLEVPPSGDRVLFTYGWVDRVRQSSPLPLSIAAYQGRFTYVADFTTDSDALYDMVADPQERLDISQAHRDVHDRLRALVRKERASF